MSARDDGGEVTSRPDHVIRLVQRSFWSCPHCRHREPGIARGDGSRAGMCSAVVWVLYIAVFASWLVRDRPGALRPIYAGPTTVGAVRCFLGLASARAPVRRGRLVLEWHSWRVPCNRTGPHDEVAGRVQPKPTKPAGSEPPQCFCCRPGRGNRGKLRGTDCGCDATRLSTPWSRLPSRCSVVEAGDDAIGETTAPRVSTRRDPTASSATPAPTIEAADEVTLLTREPAVGSAVGDGSGVGGNVAPDPPWYELSAPINDEQSPADRPAASGNTVSGSGTNTGSRT